MAIGAMSQILKAITGGGKDENKPAKRTTGPGKPGETNRPPEVNPAPGEARIRNPGDPVVGGTIGQPNNSGIVPNAARGTEPLVGLPPIIDDRGAGIVEPVGSKTRVKTPRTNRPGEAPKRNSLRRRSTQGVVQFG